MLFAKRNARFETWLDTNGYYYVKNKSNKPCFKSKLTVHLFKHFKEDTSCYKKTIFDSSLRNSILSPHCLSVRGLWTWCVFQLGLPCPSRPLRSNLSFSACVGVVDSVTVCQCQRK